MPPNHLALESFRKSRDRSFPGDAPGIFPRPRVTVFPFVVNKSRASEEKRIGRVWRACQDVSKSSRGVFASERFAGRIDFSRRNRRRCRRRRRRFE